MALQKQVLSVPFAKGLDQKTDPKQVVIGKFLTLENGIFTSIGRIKKRNGYERLNQKIEGTTTDISVGSGLANFKNELLLLNGTECYSFSDSTKKWSDKQTVTNMQLSSQQVVRNTFQQTTPDTAIHPDGLQVVSYEDSRGGSRYTLVDSSTGEQVLSDQLILSTAIKPKCFAIGNFLVILFIDTVNYHLKCLAIPVLTPLSPLPLINLVTNINPVNSTYPNYDATLGSTHLYFAYNGNNGITINSMTFFLNVEAPDTVLGESASSCIAIAVDNITGRAWVAYHNGTELKYFVFLSTLPFTPVLSPALIVANSNTILNIALIASGSFGDIYYTQTATLPSNNFISTAHLTDTGTVTGNRVFNRSVSIAGKVFTFDGLNYITVSFDSVLQPTYFVLRTLDAAVIAKFSPSLGGGTPVKNIVPETPMDANGIFLIAARQKDLLTSISGTIYTQTGINVVTLDFINAHISKVELGGNTHLTGGILSMYDGVSVVEHGFNIFPENVTVSHNPTAGGIAPGTYQYSVVYSWMDAQGQTHYSAPSVGLTSNVTATPGPIYFKGTHIEPPTTDLIEVDSTEGLAIGQLLTDLTTPGNIPANTIITAITGTTLTVNNLITTNFVDDELLIANPGLVTFQAVFGSGVNTMTASPTTNLYVGMPISDLTTPGNFTANTFITNIVGSTVTINQNTLGGSLSSPGDVIQISTIGAVDFTSVFFTGQTTITVNSTENLFVGQALSDLTTGGNLTAGTKIASIDTVNNTITLNQAVAGDSAAAPGDTLQTLDGFSNVLTIPTLRLTQKKAPIRSAVSIQVYRTEDSQTIFYLVSSITAPLLNDTTVDTVSFVDTSNDATILGNPTLYTTGGVLENIAAPACSYITTYQDRIILLPSESPNQWWFSKQNIPGAPVEFSDFFVNNVDQAGGRLVSALKMDSELVLFKENLPYYVTGVGPDSTGNQNDFSPSIAVTADVGCIDKDSVVLVPGGIMFKSLKGIYLLNRGLQVSYIGADVEGFNSSKVVSANLIEDTQQVRFCLNSGVALLYDYFVNNWSVFTNHPAVDSVIFQGEFTFLTELGKVYKETPGQFTDDGEFIKLKLVTSWLSFVGLQGFQRVYQMLFLGEYFNPHNVAVYAAYDFNPFATQQNVTQAGRILGSGVYGSDATYGESTPYGGPPQTYQFRVNLNRQKCETIQFTIEDNQLGASFGENLALSAFGFMVGTKGTLNKIVAQGANTAKP